MESCIYPEKAPKEDRILSITFASPGQQLRKIVSRSNARPTGKYPSWKTQRMHQWQSPHERNAFRLLDVYPLVLSYDAQFVEIKFSLDGEIHSHFPDLFVRLKSSKEMWEVKTRTFALQASVLRRTQFLSYALPQHGYRYRVALAEDLCREPRLSTISKLIDLGRSEIPFVEREHLRRNLFGLRSFLWDDVLSGKLGKKGRNHIARLILQGDLLIDFDQELMPSSRIWLPHGTAAADHPLSISR